MNLSLRSRLSPQASSRDQSAARTQSLSLIGKTLTSVFFLVSLLVGATLIGLLLYGFSHGNQIYEGVSIGNTDVGGMSRSAARLAVQNELAAIGANPVLLIGDNQKFYIEPKAAGIDADTEASIAAAFDYGRSGSIWTRSQQWMSALLHGQAIPIQLTIDTAKVDNTLQGAAAQIAREPQPAYITYDTNGAATIVPELPGIVFDTDTTRQALVQHILSGSSEPVELALSTRQADTVSEDLIVGLDQIQNLLSAPLHISGPGTSSWSIAADQMQALVSYKKGDRTVAVDRSGIEEFVDQIAATTDRSVKDAGITVDENGRLAALPGQTGIVVDRQATTDAIVEALQSDIHEAAIVYSTTPPEISDDVAAAAAERGEALLATGVNVTWDGGSTTLDRGDLLKALTVRIRDGLEDPFVFGFDGSIFQQQLEQTFKNVNVPVVEPHLRLVDGQIVPGLKGQSGKSVDVDTSIAAVVEAATNGTGSARLTIKTIAPELSLPETLNKIYLDDVLAESSTYYGDSSDPRRNNVQVAADLENGWLIAPGEQFSYAQFVGLVTADQGFVTGFGIVDDGAGGVTTAPVIGGGICQVSTTIFQAAFWAGLQIDERYSHPYWIQTYGEPPRGMKGLDAMVNIDEDLGTLDLKFTNTTGNWIAIQVFYDGTVLTTRILGTDPGWTVHLDEPDITDVRKPDTNTRFTESPELPEGTKLQVEYAQEGFTASIHRIVTDKDGNELANGNLVSTYGSSENTILVGTGPVTPESENS